ncbi:hypothetical protein PFNF135_00398 [Plasmodium falciparum NF135/5.C10]|uniref:Erythrocyte membrane protein 1 n=2 Tax=Plasmodium falciparum TaxID=5833 RepID=W4IPX6_PLAFA|nr:hypothetical protein PFNF135_00398 [Plasmodium falciparum NF135/5.C10]
MGQGPSSSAREDVKNESHNSARNVFENIGRKIKDIASSDAKNYASSLKGDYKRAKFHQPLLEAAKYVWYAPSNPCNFDFRFDTNAPDKGSYDRDPCHLRDTNRFSDKGDAICTNNKINCNNGGCGACAPYRRIQLCDYNLEHINKNNINSTDDLLGNLLVMAKREGDSIVNSHGHTGKGIYKSGICTSLARSFADIGDIIRGKDLFLGHSKEKEKLQTNLKNIFEKIYDQLTPEAKKHYKKDEDPNYYKLREYWWALNRNDVWEALTCSAPYYADYFKKKSGNTYNFTTEGYCGRNEGAPPTNLDYVPQFLRWFDEWAEEFCRRNKIKIDKTKEECRGGNNGKNCSREGYDCKRTDLKKNEIFMDLECPRCEEECTSYNEWIENKQKEFNKQKQKYEKEINDSKLAVNSENGKYNKEFYDKLSKVYTRNDKFFEILNKGQICENVDEKNKIDFNDLVKTFSRSEYCKSCPILGVNCENGQCNSLDEIKCTPVKGLVNRVTDKNNNTFVIDMLLNDNKKKELSADLKDDFKECDLFKKLGQQKWNCKYKCNLDVCELQNFENGIDDEKVMLIGVLIKRWLKYFLKDYNRIKEKLNHCINKGKNELICIKDCYKNCHCVEKWIKEKREEWKKIKDRYLKDYKIEDNNSSNSLNNFLQQNQFHSDVVKAIEPLKNLDELYNSSTCTDTMTSSNGNCEKMDVIKILLSKLKGKIDLCKKNHEETNNSNDCVTLLKPLNDEEDDEEQEDEPPAPKPPSTPNPCVNGGDDAGVGKITSVTDVAERMHVEAQKQMLKRSVDRSGDENKGESALKGDIKKAKFKNGASPSSLEDVCGITDQHTKDSRRRRHLRRLRLLVLRFRRRLRRGHRDYKGPCTGKDGQKRMFQVKDGWKSGKTIDTPEDVFLPPRREHFCTSNVEHLYRSASGLQGTTASHSLLGDVLLAANKEAGFIIERYKTQKTSEGFKDEATVCRAIKYSFADLGDIIRGKDMWIENNDAKRLQTNLKKIFAKIKEKLHDESMKKIYEEDKDLYTKLREDWWEANRKQIWDAMKCKTTPSDTFPCSGTDSGIPFDDYIPQRLRWMTEWAEWYCKAQNKYYGELNVCDKCNITVKGDGKCTQGDVDCGKCKTACENYKKFINTWQPQWKQMEQKYESLYKEAQENDNSSHKSTTEQDKYVVEFLSQLQKANNGDKTGVHTVYSTAARYVHQEAAMDCEKQTQFCKNKNGVKPPNGAEDVNYTFKDTPNGYDVACKCDENKQKPPETPKEDACKIVETLLNSKHQNSDVGNCQRKDKKKPYPGWDCEQNIDTNHDGACMPPRRIKLCLYFLSHENERKNLNTQEDLRKAFIKCAAAETFLSWNYYKKTNSNNLNEKLREGTIPSEFLRSMFYTFGDYRDFLFGSDISTSNKHTKALKANIDRIFNDIGKTPNRQERQKFWEKYGEDIWHGMLCALEKAGGKGTIKSTYTYNKVTFSDDKTTLEKFAERYQFLRWFTEWSDEFCRERQKKEKEVEKECSNLNYHDGCEKNKGNGNDNCVGACKGYKEYIEDKKRQYEKQAKKFDIDKSQNKPGYENYSKTEASDYLKNECLNSSCNCMKKVTEISNYWTNPHTTYNTPSLKTKCACPPPPCEIVDKILGNKSSMGYVEGCKTKYMTRGTGWLCNSSGDNGRSSEDGDVCIPPRRQRLYVKDLETLDEGAKQDDLRTAFIKCAAVETFFAWHEYKEQWKARQPSGGLLGGVGVPGAQPLSQLPGSGSGDPDPQSKLQKSGEIPNDFLRQMFYTFGDYKDIFFGKDIVKVNGNDISDTVTNILNSGKTPKDQKLTNWWTKYAPDIWQGMLCSLSYNTETKEMDNELRKRLIDETKNTVFDKVTFSDTNGTKLVEFAEKPQYKRWFQEWAEEFCLKKKHKLENIKKDCRVENGKKKCSGEGYSCDLTELKDNKLFSHLLCPSCEEDCTNFKKWIKTKKNEFDKLKEKYQKQYNGNNRRIDGGIVNDSETYYDELIKEYKNNKVFKLLSNGPICKNIDEYIELDHNNPEKTFLHSDYCKSCSILNILCKDKKCNTFDTSTCEKIKLMYNIKVHNEEEASVIDILVNDNKKKHIYYNSKDECRDIDLFKYLGKQQWNCKYKCNLDICELKKIDNGIEDEELISIEVLIKRWLEYFLKDYNKIKKNLNPCINNETNTFCIKDCYKNCKCVKKWIGTKTEEWKKIKERYLKQYNNDHEDISYNLKVFLQQGIFTNYINNALEKGETLHTLKELDECVQPNKSNGNPCEKKNVITVLLNRLTEKLESCKTQHKDPKDIEGCRTLHISVEEEDDQDTDIPAHVLPPFCNVPPNPCSDKDATNVVGVEVVAEILHQEAKEKMVKNSVVHGKGESGNGKSSLQGNIKDAKLKNGRTGTALNNVCSITKEYTNDSRPNGEPCTGKNPGRFKILDKWDSGGKVSSKDDVFLPPRRQHMCTSNLEYLIHKGKEPILEGDPNKIIHSFLGEVLLAAKYEADFIKQRYNDRTKAHGFKDEATICRAMKYSFADIGDIIKGTDLWDANGGEITTQKNLVKIFEKIKTQLKDQLNGKYKDDTDNKQLRCDWWEANRAKVWEAMKCKTNGVDITCDSDHTPLHDYIPQRLRWMVEWAEWYCKMQKEEYEKLEKQCSSCKSGKCDTEQKCKECKAKCKEYEEKIKPWKKQWEIISKKYKTLYQQANDSVNGATTSSSTDEKDKDVVDFLKMLYQKNTHNTIYSTAEGYIHQEAHISACQKQTLFCKNTSGKDKVKYAFRIQPHDYDDACICHISYPEQEALKGPCEIIDGIIKYNNGTTKVDGCEPKTKESYPGWECNEESGLVTEDGICMPPRRQKLCLYYLEHADETKKIRTQEHLRDAFIKSAGVETFLSWHHYKSKNGDGGKLDNTLKNGIIPPEFLRSMFYTFADLRAFLFGTDISINHGEGSRLKDTIDSLFPNGSTQNGLDRQKWWDEYGASIWKGMLCALEHASGNKYRMKRTLIERYGYKTVTFTSTSNGPTLSEFSERPPFLRWLTEWGENFCKQRGIKVKELVKGCKDCGVHDHGKTCTGKCGECKTQCEEYKKWLETWKEHYNNQKENFLKNKNKYKDDPDVEKSKNAYEYLKTKLENIICNSGTTTFYCNCIDKMPSTDGSSEKMPPSLEYPPIEIEGKCDFQQKEATPPPKVPEVPKKPVPEKKEEEPSSPTGTSDENQPETPVLQPEEEAPAPDVAPGTQGKDSKPPKSLPKPPQKPPQPYLPPALKNAMLSSTIMWSVGIGFAAIRDTSGDEDKYAFMSDTTDVTSSESEYEDLDINDIYVPGSPKYKTLIEVVLEPSKSNGNIPHSAGEPLNKCESNPLGDDMVPTTNTFTDEEWNELKHDFISQYIQSRLPMDVPQYDVSTQLPMNIGGNVLDDDNDGGNVPIDNKKLNTDVSIQIDIDENKGKKEFSNMDTILDNIEDDIYYDVNDDENPSVDHIPMDHNKVDVPKKVHVEMKILNNTSNGSLEPEFPISDVWNI